MIYCAVRVAAIRCTATAVSLSAGKNSSHARPLDDFRSGLRTRGYMCDDLTNPEFNRGSYCLAKRATVGGHITQVSRRALAVLDLHSRRNDLNAASTSSSLANPPRSASSTAASSSGVA